MMCRLALVQTNAGGLVGFGKQLGLGMGPPWTAPLSAKDARAASVTTVGRCGSKDRAGGRLACSLNLPTWAAASVAGEAREALQLTNPNLASGPPNQPASQPASQPSHLWER
ncbi:hypothetical protein RB595_002395 [Gaeumannomyces hyphopodioides]